MKIVKSVHHREVPSRPGMIQTVIIYRHVGNRRRIYLGGAPAPKPEADAPEGDATSGTPDAPQT